MTINVGLHSISVWPPAPKAKFDPVSADVSWESHTRRFSRTRSSWRLTYSDHGLWRGKAGNQPQLSLSCMEADGLIGQAIIGLSTSLNLKFVTLKCSVQQSSTFNANRTREQVKPIKDDFWFLISDFRFLISGFWFRVSGFGFLTSDFWFLFSDFGCLISDFCFRFSGFGFQTDFGF